MASGTLLIVAMAAFVAVGAAHQQPQPPMPGQPQPTDNKPTTEKNTIVVRGCVNGSMLTHAEAREYVSTVPNTMRLTGSRSVRGMLKEMEGRRVEVVGTLKGGRGSQETGALVKDTGKTKIYVGGTERRTAEERMMQTPPLPTLDIKSVKDISVCSSVD
jgi:glucose/arabinose dehydrogenase